MCVCIIWSGSSNSKAFDYGLDGLGSIQCIGGVEIFLLRVQTGPGVHSASYKISTGGIRGFSRGQRRPSVGLATLPLPSARAVYMWTLYSHPPWAFMACNGDIFTFMYIIIIIIIIIKIRTFCPRSHLSLHALARRLHIFFFLSLHYTRTFLLCLASID